MLDIRPLPDDLQKIAREELHEIPERMEEDINEFREWIRQQSHLNARTDDQFLIGFLRGCKYSMEKAKSKLDRYYTLKTKYPKFYSIRNLDDPRMLELCKMGVGLNLPTPLNENGPRIQFVRAGIYPTNKYNFADILCLASTFQALVILIDDYCIINGYIQILDLSEFTLTHMLQMTPAMIKKMFTFSEEALPFRQQAIHIINAPKGFDRLYNMAKSLMPLKQQERLYVHGNNLESLYNFVPQKYLPKEMGGSNSSIDELNRLQWETFLEYRNYFIEESQYGVNEKLRINKIMDPYDSLGCEGSFRKLEVD